MGVFIEFPTVLIVAGPLRVINFAYRLAGMVAPALPRCWERGNRYRGRGGARPDHRMKTVGPCSCMAEGSQHKSRLGGSLAPPGCALPEGFAHHGNGGVGGVVQSDESKIGLNEIFDGLGVVIVALPQVIAEQG